MVGSCLLTLALLASQDPATPPVDSTPSPELRVESADGAVRRLPLAGLKVEDPAALGGVLVDVEGLTPPALVELGEDSIELELRNGGRLNARLQGGDGERLDLQLVGETSLRVMIEELDALRFPARLPRGGRQALEPAPVGDRLYRVAGEELDRIDGAIEAFEFEGLRFESDLGSKLYPWSEVAACFVEALDDSSSQDGEGTPVIVDLVDGSRLRAGFLRWDEDRLELRTSAGRGVALANSAISEVFFDDGRLRFLSDMTPIAVEEASPFGDELGLSWPHRMDRSVTGGPLTAGGRLWSRGIGVHAPSRLTFALDGAWRELRGAVAIDDEVLRLSAKGSVIFRVHVDGEQRFESPLLRGGDAVVELPRISVEGAHRVVLEVDLATELHVADRADWLGVVLVK
ncbi:MAG: NPCBM/NEW2 domain-containing protein [Planctomycetes bacterium]|nr:NPCBM/NEW2 domain-containing protein [Planctomycetota bacterium]